MSATTIQDWHQEVLIPHPRPEVACRDASPEETPRSAASLAKAATASGWTARVTYARGATVDAHWKPGRVVDSIAVRLSLGQLRAVATWVDGKFASAWVWGDDLGMRPMKSRPLAALVKALQR